MNLLRYAMVAVLAAGLITAAAEVVAEAPDRDRMAEDLFVLRTHFLLSDPPVDDGIWRFDPLTGSYEKQRQFFINDSDVFTHYGYFGIDGLNLAAIGDTLHTQHWPWEFVFDVFSWRMTNRLPTPEVEGAYGWALQGPVLAPGDVQGTGLEPGTYGIPRCVGQEATYWHNDGTDCTPLTLADGTIVLEDTETRLLLFDGRQPASLGHSRVVTWFNNDPNPVSERPVLSFDSERGGFWRGTNLGAVFHQVIDGQVQPPSISVDFEVPTEQGYDDLSTMYLHYQPVLERLFAVALVVTWNPYDLLATFFSVDPESGQYTVYRPSDNPEASGNAPISLTSLAAKPETYEQMIPIIAETPGAEGTFWTTDLWLFNPADSAATVTLRSLVAPEQERVVELGVHQSTRIDNVLAFMGGGAGGDGRTHDALYLESTYSWGAQVVAYGRMWTPDPAGAGTFGHGVPAVPAPYGYSNHKAQDYLDTTGHWTLLAGRSPSYLTLDLREDGRFRHNLGVVNVGDEPLQLTLIWAYSDLWDWAGDLNDENRPPETITTIEVPPHSVKIFDVVNLFPEHITSSWPPRIAVLGDRPAPVWFSMIDNRTGDATFVPYTNFIHSSPRPWDPSYSTELHRRPYRMVLPVAAHTPGANGTLWQTDLYGYAGNGVHGEDEPNVAFYPERPVQQCGGAADGETLVQDLQGELGIPLERWMEVVPHEPYYPPTPETAASGWHTIFPDVVHLFPECGAEQSIHGGLGILVGSWFAGFSRTFTTREDGGTYGAMQPLYPPNGWPVQHFAGLELSDETRINLGFFNGDQEHAITHRVTLYAADGTRIAERTLTLEPLASKQLALQSFFAGVELPPGTYGLTVLPLDQPPDGDDPGYQGHSWAYVSVIDNLTNDPINLW